MKERIVKCPTCRRSSQWTMKNPYRPFCSRRCKLLDFSEWVEERRSIGSEELPQQAEPSEDRDEYPETP